jgi:hypothetical protein
MKRYIHIPKYELLAMLTAVSGVSAFCATFIAYYMAQPQFGVPEAVCTVGTTLLLAAIAPGVWVALVADEEEGRHGEWEMLVPPKHENWYPATIRGEGWVHDDTQ